MNLISRLRKILEQATRDVDDTPTAPLRPATPKAAPAMSARVVPLRPAMQPAGRAEETSLKRIEHLDDVPANMGSFAKLADGVVPLPPTTRKHVVVLKTDENRCIILLHGDSARSSSEHMTVRTLLRQARWIVDGIYIASSPVFDALSKSDDNAKHVEVGEGESAQIFDTILARAKESGATDIHICIREQSAKVLFRINKLLHPLISEDREKAIAAVSVAYNKLADPHSRSKEDPQFSPVRSLYCSIERVVSGERYRIRYQSYKVAGGLDVVLRMLPSDVMKVRTLDNLGYSASHIEQLTLANASSHGAIFIAGPTNSGKSTTLATLTIMNPDRLFFKNCSIEDPVEHRLYGTSQIPVQRDITRSDAAGFAEALRSLLRADPDNINVGEMRDKETADLVVAATLSGHLTRSTIHANSALGIVGRLTAEPMLLPRAVLASQDFLLALVYQELMPTLCQCSLPAEELLGRDYLGYIEHKFQVSTANMRVAKPNGCPKCRGGVNGMTVAAEIVVPSADILQALGDGKDTLARSLWRSSRLTGFDDPDMTGKTALEHALFKSLNGLIDPRAVERIKPFKAYDVHSIGAE